MISVCLLAACQTRSFKRINNTERYLENFASQVDPLSLRGGDEYCCWVIHTVSRIPLGVTSIDINIL